jgi:hypothetical protein
MIKPYPEPVEGYGFLVEGSGEKPVSLFLLPISPLARFAGEGAGERAG